MADIKIMVFDPQAKTAKQGDIETLSIAEKQWLWIDIGGELDADAIKLLHEHLRIPALAIQDARRTRHPPKLELLDEFTFLLLREIVPGASNYDPLIGQLSLFVNSRALVTIHRNSSAAIAKAVADIDRKAANVTSSAPHFAYVICRALADDCEPVVLAHEEELAQIEDQLFDDNDGSALELLSRLSRILRRLRRILSYQATVFERLHQRVREKVVPLGKHESNDLFENMDRLATLCELNQALASDLLNTYLGVASHRLNVVMRVLTVATIVFLPLGLIAGIYGMNFELMPELSWKYGYFGALGTMAVVAIGLTLFFRFKRWL